MTALLPWAICIQLAAHPLPGDAPYWTHCAEQHSPAPISAPQAAAAPLFRVPLAMPAPAPAAPVAAAPVPQPPPAPVPVAATDPVPPAPPPVTVQLFRIHVVTRTHALPIDLNTTHGKRHVTNSGTITDTYTRVRLHITSETIEPDGAKVVDGRRTIGLGETFSRIRGSEYRATGGALPGVDRPGRSVDVSRAGPTGGHLNAGARK